MFLEHAKFSGNQHFFLPKRYLMTRKSHSKCLDPFSSTLKRVMRGIWHWSPQLCS